MVNRSSSKQPYSRLIELFLNRSESGDTPEAAMRVLARRLLEQSTAPGGLDRLLSIRNIDQYVGIVDDLAGDGEIEPKGRVYTDGFRMRLRGGQPAQRIRFTKAHEICHTFFYELVPELKFCPHTLDSFEERLCNIGAEELLMPLSRVQAEAARLPVSIESLDRLAHMFKVSSAAMFLRLRKTGLWRCDLTYWHWMTDGSFVLDKSIGAKKDFQIDSAILYRIWHSGQAKSESGITYLRQTVGIYSGVKRVYYQAYRRGNSIVVLLGRRRFALSQEVPPLLQIATRSKVHNAQS